MVSQDSRRGSHSSPTALQGLDKVLVSKSSPTTLGPVSPKSQSKDDERTEAEDEDEVKEIERLEERVEELELEREEAEERVPTVADVEGPSQAEVDRHEVTHTPPNRRIGAKHARKAWP